MPWRIEEREGRYCVVKETDGSTEKCHATRADAERHVRALYASEEMEARAAAVDNSSWDGSRALGQCDSAADFRSICAGERGVGEPDERQHWALPHHYLGKGPNAAGVRNALARLGQTEGLKNAGAARSHLEGHMSSIQGSSENRSLDDRLPIESRSAALGGVDFPHRLIEVIAVPYEQEAIVEYRGEFWEESFDRGSFTGVETRAGKIKAYRDHDPLDGTKKWGLVGRAVALYPDREEGLVGSVKIAKTPLGDETLSLADEGILGVSVGFGVRGSDQVLDRANRKRRIRRAFLDHLGFPDNGAYEGAGVINVRSKLPPAGDLPRLETPLLDDVVAWMESRRQRA